MFTELNFMLLSFINYTLLMFKNAIHMKNIPADIIRQLFMILFIVLMGGVLFKSLVP